MRIFVLILALFFALPASAVNDWGHTSCTSTSTSANKVGAKGLICFDFNSSFLANQVTQFSVETGTALACFDPNIATAGAATATGTVWFCPTGGATTAACGVQVCAPGGCVLDGTNAAPNSQLACVVLGPGAYLLESIVPPGAQTGLFSVRGGQ